MDQSDKRKLDNKLMSMGLGNLADPGLIRQLGLIVQGHKHLSEIVQACAPEDRNTMFEAIRPHLRFKPYALDFYLMHRGSIILTDQIQ